MIKTGDEVYYVNPFVFTIEKTTIFGLQYLEGEEFFIDDRSAVLAKEDVHSNLDEARLHARKLLDKFYEKRIREIHLGEIIRKGENRPESLSEAKMRLK